MKFLRRIVFLFREKGILYIVRIIIARIERFLVAKGILKKRIKKYSFFKSQFTGKNGIEIGGLSPIFGATGYLPIYPLVNKLDGCNFSSTTLWEGNIQDGESYNFFKKKYGTQYISEATDLHFIPDEKYDFVISSNCLEHIANPLKALEDWKRVLKKDGLLLLLVPNKKYFFDHKRPIVTFSHLFEDYQKGVGENDLTHLDEILILHDLEMDKHSGTFEQFKTRSLKNFENRTLHHHVFDGKVLEEIYNYLDFEILLTDENKNHLILGRKKNSNGH